MRNIILILMLSPILASAQSAIGKWITVDDNTGEEKSVVEIFEKQGKVYGKVVKLFRPPSQDQDPVCEKCGPDDPRHKKKIIGMEIIQGLEKDDDAYSGGNILDPQNGKIYRCKLWVEGHELKVRGYWGPFFRTQIWKRLD